MHPDLPCASAFERLVLVICLISMMLMQLKRCRMTMETGEHFGSVSHSTIPTWNEIWIERILLAPSTWFAS